MDLQDPTAGCSCAPWLFLSHFIENFGVWLHRLWFYNFLSIQCIDSTHSRLLSQVFMADITAVNFVDLGSLNLL